MCNKKDIIKKVYEDLLKDKKTFATLKSELSLKSQLDEAFICKHILPLAKKVDPEITWQDILAFEKEALSQPTELTLNDLENISGGKASNVLMSFGLLALMGFSGLAANNVASADFIEFTKTKEYSDYNTYLSKGDDASTEEREKYEFVTLGEVPFYLQADHMVDGLLWFKSPDENKAFFVMDRKFENKNAVYTYSAEVPSQLNLAEKEKSINKPSFDVIQKLEFRLIDINIDNNNNIDIIANDLKLILSEIDQQKLENLVDYLNKSINDAAGKPFNTVDHANSQTLQLADDNPLYNFSRFYNPRYRFNSKSQRQNLEEIPMYAKNKNGIFKTIDFDPEIKNEETTKKAYAEKLAKHLKEEVSWSIAHRTRSKKEPTFKTIESSNTLRKNLGLSSENTFKTDIEVLRNDSFTFFTLQLGENRASLPSFIGTNKQHEIYEDIDSFDGKPFMSCSKDMISRLKEDKPEKREFFPCFNGSSEEVKEQIIKYYINELYKKLENKADFNEKNFETHAQALIKTIHNAELEVRIPARVSVKNWLPYRRTIDT